MTEHRENRYKNIIVTCCFSMALAVLLGAFGAHLLEDRLSSHYMDIYQTGNFYHFVQTLGWLIVILIAQHYGIHDLKWTNIFFGLGIFLFCVSLYVLSFNEHLEMPGLRKLGAITPIGGVCFVLAWLTAAYRFYKK